MMMMMRLGRNHEASENENEKKSRIELIYNVIENDVI